MAVPYHPDVSGDPAAGRVMARINAAYDLLASPSERALWDRANPVRVSKPQSPPAGSPPRPADRPATAPPSGPPPGSAAGQQGPRAAGPRPGPSSARPQGSAGPRPTGAAPAGAGPAPSPRVPPSLDEAFAYVIGFGKFRGRTLASVALVEPGYLRWILRAITDKPELVRHVRIVVEHLDRQRANGSGQPTPPPRPAPGPTSGGAPRWPGEPPSGARPPTPPRTSGATGPRDGTPRSTARPPEAGAGPRPESGPTSAMPRPPAAPTTPTASLARAKALLGPAQIVACLLVGILLGSFFIQYALLDPGSGSSALGIALFMGLPAALFGGTGFAGLYLYWHGWRADRRRARR